MLTMRDGWEALTDDNTGYHKLTEKVLSGQRVRQEDEKAVCCDRERMENNQAGVSSHQNISFN